VVNGVVAAGGFAPVAYGVPQSGPDVSPQATPEIKQVTPEQAAPAGQLRVAVEGLNSSRGVYVSFSTPAVRAVSSRRVSATELEVPWTIGGDAPQGAIGPYVSNPASAVAEAPFTVGATQASPARPAAAAFLSASEGTQSTAPGTPEVVAIDPARAARGSQLSVKVTGKNFSNGAKVSFSNPGIRVLGINPGKSTELVAKIQVAEDAPVGKTSLFVVNSDDSETEAAFEVTEAGGGTSAGTGSTAGSATRGRASAPQRFGVTNVGDTIGILQNPSKQSGSLILAVGKLSYEEAGKEVFSAPLGDIKEIEVNLILGVNTGTFHVILNSGKSFNFMAASLRPVDSQAIVDSIHGALH
jgi:hypothetical protein